MTRPNALALFIGLLFAGTAAAAEWPITELGSCRDQAECRLFCEVPTNRAACWSYQTYGAETGAVLAETDSTLAATPTVAPSLKPSIFPIAELAGCTDVKACRVYCDDPTHFSACQAVAQKHGLTRAATAGQSTALLARAKQELGCTSLQQCRAYCAEPTNSEQCQSLAEQYGPAKYRVARHALLQKARAILGCTSVAECRALCEEATNKARCAVFMKEHTPTPFLKKIRAKADEESAKAEPLPCTTLEECRVYCSDPAHATACKISGESQRVKLQLEAERNFSCRTKIECERYCQAKPEACPNYAQSADYQALQRQKQQRLEAGSTAPTKVDIERYRNSLLTPSATPLAPDSAPAN